MQKNLMKLYIENWDRKIQREILEKFLLFDNFKDMNREFAVQFFSQNHGIRILHIGLALYYINKKDEEFVNMIANDTMQDLNLMGEKLFSKTMTSIFARLKFSGPTIWEDTDRGNLNIYYTPFQNEISIFKEKQEKLLVASLKNITV